MQAQTSCRTDARRIWSKVSPDTIKRLHRRHGLEFADVHAGLNANWDTHHPRHGAAGFRSRLATLDVRHRGVDEPPVRGAIPANQPASPACTDVAPLGSGNHERRFASVTEKDPETRPMKPVSWSPTCTKRGGASQVKTAKEQTWGFPAGKAPPGPGAPCSTRGQGPDGSNWGQLLPPVRGNARRHVWRRRTKSSARKDRCVRHQLGPARTGMSRGCGPWPFLTLLTRNPGPMETKPQAQHSTGSAQHRLSTGSAQAQHRFSTAAELSTSSAQHSRKQFYLESFVNSSNGGLRAARSGRSHKQRPKCIYA